MKITLIDMVAKKAIPPYQIPSLPVVSVGRHTSNEVVIPNRDYRNSLSGEDKVAFDAIAGTISTNHCIIYQENGRPCIEDNNSKNGTSLRGVGLTDGRSGHIQNGDILYLGSYRLEVRIE